MRSRKESSFKTDALRYLADMRNTTSADEGLLALVMLLRFHGLGVDPEQIRHRFGGSAIGIPEMLRCARELGLKARSHATPWKRLVRTPLPAIAALRDGGFLVLGKIGDDLTWLFGGRRRQRRRIDRERWSAYS
jgi:ABC-type bacteriocin/lantibiotic exporter with double-glycine peptidase domain